MGIIFGLEKKLKQAGYKLTPARLAVIEVLETYSDHLSNKLFWLLRFVPVILRMIMKNS